ncbi:polymer-forming cytoskeletal protein [Maridesulfovibrio ferrireducens]|nr:polymer-forming cytoskeletal protein [Maridesulfovibrio ferrireducens]MBI9111790.1 polymer-forming cytoskeletal protein [Maridesulfovibrio ferrireducens]
MARDEINAFLGSGTDYHGKLSFQGAVRIDGNFSGEVESEGTLVVGKDARVEGVLRIGQLVLSGKVTGEVYARDKAVLHKTANLQGDLVTPVLVVEEGAVLEGRVTMSSTGVEAVETETEEIS